MSPVILKKPNGEFEREPSSVTIIESDGGVYISHDMDASEFEFRFKEGWEVVGTYYGDVDLIGDPSDTGSWISEIN